MPSPNLDAIDLKILRHLQDDGRLSLADLAAYERFLKTKLTRLEGIASIESSFALEQVKYTNVLPVA
jgi:DNA-binding Lrp family transcriptional regulator